LVSYIAAVHACIEAGGDVDTTAPTVVAIVAAHLGIGPTGVPRAWLERHSEPLPPSARRPSA